MQLEPRYKKGDKIGGRYQVHQALIGGMGEVYLCLDLEEMLPLALKTFQQRYQTKTQRLRVAFEKEVSTWVALEKHPNIVRCFYMDILDNQPFMILEWIAGEPGRGTDLRGWLRRGPLDLRQALDFTIDICRGLIHAQEKQPGMVHRDLKPENILIAQGGLAKVTDFGLATIAEAAGLELIPELDGKAPHPTTGHRTTTISIQNQKSKIQNPVVGTPAYMAPEQWRGESLDERTDIYALGCMLYEMLTGECPFQVDFVPTTPGRFQQWLSAMQAEHESGRVPALPASLPAALGDLLGSCLAKARTERPASLSELLSQLESLYQGQFTTAPRAAPAVAQFTVTDYVNRGMTYFNLSRYDEALRDYRRAIELDPNYAKAYSNRGLTYADLQRYDEALGDYNQAIELDPNLAPAYSNRGNAYAALQRHDEALGDYSRAITLDPNLAPAYYNRGNTYSDLQHYEAALADYSRAIELDFNFAQAYFNRGNTYKKLQRYDEALPDYSQAIELDPNHTSAYSNRGNTYSALQRYDEAMRDYNQAIKLDPKYAQAYFNRGTTYAVLRRYDEALRDMSRAIKLDPKYAQAYSSRGTTYAVLQRYDEALRDLSRAIELDSKHAQAYYNRGTTYADVQRYDEALRDLSRAIELDPTYASAYLNLGALLGNQGMHQQALSYLEKAAQLGDPRGAQYVAVARQALGIEIAPPVDPAQQAFEAFQQAGSAEAMQQAVARFPFMAQADFIAAIEQVIAQQVPSEHRPAFERRLAWLRQIANEKRSGFLGRLFGKRK